MPNPKKHLEIPLNGKLVTAEPTTIGTNFRSLVNMRHTDTHPKGIMGNTKINTIPLATNLKVRNAYHFKKDQFVESHVLAQAYTTGLTSPIIIDNTTPIPSVGHFNELMTLNVAATASNFPVGATVHGDTSGATCIIVKMLTTLTYIVRSRVGTFTLGEVLHDGTNSADQGAANPTFALSPVFTESSGAGRGYFSDAPDGQMIYCNGVDNCIWGGDETEIKAFVTSNVVVDDTGVATTPKDYTERLNNTKTDGENVVRLGGGNDAYVKLLIQGDQADGTAGTSILDSETSAKTITAVGNAQVDTSQAKFGIGSILFDGTGDYLTVPDSADWYFAAAPFTIDCWVRGYFKYLYDQPICGQYVDANNYWYFGFISQTFVFKIVAGGVTKANYYNTNEYTDIAWRHIELVRNATNVYLFIDGVSQTLTVVTAISTNEVPNLAAVLEIGAVFNHATVMNGWLDEFRISKGIARDTSNFTPPVEPYRANVLTFLVGSPRALQGFKPYVAKPNVAASTMSGKVWNGTTWDTLTLTDNTSVGGISLAQTGKINFTSTVSNTKPKYIEGYFLFWYQFTLSAGSATIYQVTLDAPFQPIVDLWDGTYREVSAAYKRLMSDEDISTKILRDDYDAYTVETYADLSSMAAFDSGTGANALEIGFMEKQCGLHFRIPPDFINSTAATTMFIDYWNGTTYVTVGSISDGTSQGSISFSKSGTVSWNNTNLLDETKTNKLQAMTVWNPMSDPTTTESIWGWTTSVAKYVAFPLYFYRVRFDKAMNASCRLNYVGGITAQNAIGYYKFPIFAQGRILLCCDQAGDKSKITCSGKWLTQVYNGMDSVDIFFGGDGELNCGIELFSQYGGNLYSMILMFKDTETYVMTGQDIASWGKNTYTISTSIGCPAPLTLKKIDLAAEPGQGVNRSLAIWQGVSGIFMSDGRAPIPIHGDIKEYFDKSDSRCIRASMIGDSIGLMDWSNQEYHWKFASGSSATGLNTELVYDLKRNKWYEINRGTGMDLQCGVEVQDTDGNQYDYGFIDTGYMERLEYGTTFDGNSIAHTMYFGDFAPLGLAFITQLDHLKLITMAKTTTTQDVVCSHYSDTLSTSSDKTMDVTKTGYRVTNPAFDDKLQGAPYHSLKFTTTTNDEACGFEPIALVATLHQIQED